MKNINQYITEKLKIDSNIKDNSGIVSEILTYWGIDEDDKDIFDVIQKWVNKNNVNEVYPVISDTSFEDAKEFLSNEVLKQYSKDEKDIDKCYDILEQMTQLNEYHLYNHHDRGEVFDIYGNSEMICITGWYGALYCLKK